METKTAIYSNLAIPPGEYLEEVIAALGMTKDELARRMSRSPTKLSPIFKGNKAITSNTALQLEKVVGVPAHIWTGLEAEYRLTLARQQEKEKEYQLKSETSMVSKFCYKELVKLGIVADKKRPVEKILELHRFFGVTSLSRVLDIRRYQPDFRCGKSYMSSRSPEAIAAWLRMGEILSRKITCAPFDITRLEKYFKDFRAMTLKHPNEFQEPLQKNLAEAGVAMVICPHFPRIKAHGATFWLSKDKAILMLTIRYAWADIFWFSLFHEIGHIMLHLHGRQAVILEDDSESPEMKEQEKEADSFAADLLIPPNEYKDFIAKGNYYKDDICVFAHRIGIDTGIVVGRLQNDGYLEKEWHNDLRTRYKLGQNHNSK